MQHTSVPSAALQANISLACAHAESFAVAVLGSMWSKPHIAKQLSNQCASNSVLVGVAGSRRLS